VLGLLDLGLVRLGLYPLIAWTTTQDPPSDLSRLQTPTRISNYTQRLEVDEVGRVVSVGDGTARLYGLNNIQAGEMVEF
jgi:hypothetical protein